MTTHAARTEPERRPEEPEPRPERDEPTVPDPGVGDLSARDYVAITIRAIRSALADNVTNLAAAVAYNAFLTIPSVLLVALGGFSLLAGPSAVHTITTHLSSVMPKAAISLIGPSLTRTTQAHGGGVAMIVAGVLLALWSLSGAVQTVMWATNLAYDCEETRGFVKKRLVAAVMVVCAVAAFVLVFVLLILGPHMTTWVSSAIGHPTAVTWVWWVAQWPILLIGLMAAFAVTLHLAPNVTPPTWRLVTPGAVFAVVVWLAASGAFAFYTSRFSSYDKTWGSLAAVIIMLTWLWLSSLALLLGAEINAETERSRLLRRGAG